MDTVLLTVTTSDLVNGIVNVGTDDGVVDCDHVGGSVPEEVIG